MVTIGNAHDDLIHDAVLDYYGKRLATCSSDKTIKIFEVDGENHKLLDTLIGHEGPVWQVSWAHPKFGVILASCSYDGKAIIWKEEKTGWTKIAEHSVHQASVNSISWGPHEYGAVLLCTSSDGKVSVVEFKDDGSKSHIIFQAHAIGVNCGSWAPPFLSLNSIEKVNGNIANNGDNNGINNGEYNNNNNNNSNDKDNNKITNNQNNSENGASGNSYDRRFVTGGCDNTVKIWKYNPAQNTYVQEHVLTGHSDWVRDVAWSSSLLSKTYIASASQDRTVLIWTKSENSDVWKKQLLTDAKFPDVCWRASWSASGNVLAVSGGDNKVTLWKENLKGSWELAGEVDQ